MGILSVYPARRHSGQTVAVWREIETRYGERRPVKIDAASLKWELQHHPFFEALSGKELDALLQRAHSVVFKTRQNIFVQGAESDSLYIILSGRVKVGITSETGKETVLAFMGRNEVLGEMGVFDGGERSATATALEETRALQLLRTDVLSFLENKPAIALQIIGAFCGRLRHANDVLEDMATLPAGPRLARALLRLAETHGKSGADGNIEIDIKLSQANLGAHAGMMRENVNRQLRLWESEGLIRSMQGVITLVEPDRLRSLTDE